MPKKVMIIGAGPGGYTAAFHAADHGLEVTLIDHDPVLGGVCLNRGCIPSKALLHVAKIIHESREAKDLGLEFSEPRIDLDKIRSFKKGVVQKLTGGLAQLAKQRKVKFLQGRASFLTSNRIAVFQPDGQHQELEADHVILAAGSVPIGLPFAPLSGRVWDSTRALDLDEIPKRLLVIGGGYIGMELASVYQALGSAVTIVEMTPSLLPGADRDLSMILQRRAKTMFEDIRLKTRVTAIHDNNEHLTVDFESDQGQQHSQDFDTILVAIGRKNIFDGLGLGNTKVSLTNDEKFIRVNAQRQTDDPAIFAIGDITGPPMLAHKASAEAKAAVEAIAGEKTGFDPKAIPGVVFTDPEIAWCGLTEAQAKENNLDVTVSKFPWAACGRAIAINRAEGMTKIIADTATGRILGAAMAGPGAGAMISEAVLAIEMGALAKDIALSIHPHPTLSETFMEAAEGLFGQATHIYRKR